MIYKTIDLCAGIGGIRKGFELTGKFENVLSAEIDLYACNTYKHLYGEDPFNDLTTEEFKHKVSDTDYDVLLAGFPCQTFSRAGKKMGFRDKTRGTIFFSIADIISRTNPRAVFLENVENLTSHDHGETIKTIVETLEDELQYRIIGVTVDENGTYCYSAKSFVRNTKNFGLPQNRPRAYIMAFSKKRYGAAVKKLTSELPEYGDKVIFRSVSEILDTDVDAKYYMASGYLETLKKHKARQVNKGYGFGYCIVNDPARNSVYANTILATGGSGKERNLIYQPKDGIAGVSIAGKKTPLNNEGIRVMTPNEWGKLQGFIGYAFVDSHKTDHFSFPEGTTDGQKYKQFGNSVSIPVIEKMASFMLECFETLQNEQKEIVSALAKYRPYFSKRDVMDELELNSNQAGILLAEMIEAGDLRRISNGKSTRYTRNIPDEQLPPYSQEEKIIDYLKKKRVISNIETQEFLCITPASANVLLSIMTKKGVLNRISRGVYELSED